MDRERRKQGRRALQQQAVQKKSSQEDQVFWNEARNVARHGTHRMTPKQLAEQEQELFSQQGTQGINFAKYDAIEVKRTGPNAETIPILEDFNQLLSVLPPFLARNIQLMRYSRPTPIQKHAVMLSLYGLDTMCCAQTGSGKTCAFLLPIVASFSTTPSPVHPSGAAAPRALVLAPTRELASQIHLEARKLTNASPHQTVCVYGGADARSQLMSLARGVDILVATPGRLTDFLDRGLVTLSHVSHLVLDEADRMLDMGFEPQIRRIVQRADLPARETRQTMMFSATFPGEIQKLAAEFMRSYVFVAVGRVGATTDDITQRIVLATADKKSKLQLCLQALNHTDGRTLVFVQKKRDATWVKKQLAALGIVAEDIHGDRAQNQRENALALFREGKIRILVATDVASRGLDIPAVTHVINFDLPPSPDDFDTYVHRIGRTGRAGNTGLATSFYVPGFTEKVGNGRLWSCLHQLLTEAKQEIPPWFMQLPESRGNMAPPSNGGGAKRSGPAQTDVRRGGGGGGGGGRGGGGGGGPGCVGGFPQRGPTPAAVIAANACHSCGQVGHRARDCPTKAGGRPASAPAQFQNQNQNQNQSLNQVGQQPRLGQNNQGRGANGGGGQVPRQQQQQQLASQLMPEGQGAVTKNLKQQQNAEKRALQARLKQETAPAHSNAQAQQTKKVKDNSCRKCGTEGHFARDCK